MNVTRRRPARRSPGFRWSLLAAVVVGWAPGPGLLAQVPESLTGRVRDQATGAPVSGALVSIESVDGLPIEGMDAQALTDGQGDFRLDRVPAGTYMVRVRHLTYGVHLHPVRVQGMGTAAAEIRISPTAIQLEPIVAIGDATGARTPASRNTLTRARITEAAESGQTLGDLLRRNVSGMSQRSMRGGDIGSFTCVEFRGARIGDGECRPPQVYLDGVVVPNPLNFFSDFSLDGLHQIEVIPPSQAGVFGPDGGWGVIRLQTTRPGYADAEGIPTLVRRTVSLDTRYDWSAETESHPSFRVYAAATLGNAVGLAAAGAVLSQCMDLRTRSFFRGDDYCGAGAILGSGILAAALPPVTASLAARWAGTTDGSTGVLQRSILYSLPAFVPGFAIASIGAGEGSLGGLEIAGLGMILVGAPILNTIADRIYRRPR